MPGVLKIFKLLTEVFQLADNKELGEKLFSINGLKVAFIKTSIRGKVGPGTKAAWEKAKSLLTEAGASIKEIELLEDFAKIANWHANILAGEGRTSFLGNK